jgi:hypothetical protein
VTEKRKNKSDGEQTYAMMGRVSLRDLANWQEGGDRRGVGWVTTDLRERKINNVVKTYSRSCLIQPNLISQTCLMDGSDMTDGLRLDNLL